MIIDLCSGIGTWGDDSVRIDIDASVRPTIQADVRYLPLRPGLKVKMVHASPPCTFISKARSLAWGWNPLGVAETLELAAKCWRAFDYLDAEDCSFEWPENFEKLMGTRIKFRYDKADIKQATTNFYINKKTRRKAQKRAEIPIEVRQTILERFK